MKIPISFKKSEEELYNFLNSKRSPSIYVKDLLEKEMKKDIKKDDANNDYDGFDF